MPLSYGNRFSSQIVLIMKRRIILDLSLLSLFAHYCLPLLKLCCCLSKTKTQCFDVIPLKD